MRSILFPVYNWVKNVYSLCVEYGYSRGLLYTVFYMQPPVQVFSSVQPSVSPHLLASFTPGSYTAFLLHIPLLYSHLYPLSTVPTITKTNEK